MSTLSPPIGVGDLLRGWRQRRRLSQLDLSNEAEVSARHLSFVETGRSRPSRELLLHLAEHLEVPLRERNSLLLAAGYAPAFPERPLEDEAMDPVRDALDQVLAGHEPYPAVIVDRRWDIVTANGPALSIFTEGVDPELLQPPINAYRLGLHPKGLAPRVRNFGEYSAHLVTQLSRDVALSGSGELAVLLGEIKGYPGVERGSTVLTDPAQLLFLPIRLGMADGSELSLFSTIATFGTALDVTLAELSIEAFFPADKATQEALQRRAG
ncbi:MAG TPA: helix-turn-helix transcriptional regulator [Acidimicrobiales bacterium]|nr:helix-turn-helix transcriptional regulator [Acidimicrobiales bacterium]